MNRDCYRLFVISSQFSTTQVVQHREARFPYNNIFCVFIIIVVELNNVILLYMIIPKMAHI